MTSRKPTRHSRSYVVTGASSGTGLEIVRFLHRRGHVVIATGRRRPSERPESFPDIGYHAADLGDIAAASASAASKDGVVAVGKSIAGDPRCKHGITVQIAAPGPMDAPHAERHAPPGSRRDRRAKPEAIAASVLKRLP